MEEIESDDLFQIIREEAVQHYSGIALHEYIIATGQFLDPVMRVPYTDRELAILDKLARRAHPRAASTLQVRCGDQSRYEDAKEKFNAGLGLDNIIAACCIGPIIDAVERNGVGKVSVYRDLLKHLATFDHYFEQIQLLDASFASICLEQYILRIVGPRNHPTVDEHNLIPFILDHMKEKRQKVDVPLNIVVAEHIEMALVC